MAIMRHGPLPGVIHGKLGGFIYVPQPDGTTIIRSETQQRLHSPGERKGQRRMKLATAYFRSVADQPVLKTVYDDEAKSRHMRPCDLIVSDYLTDPIILGIETPEDSDGQGGKVIVVTGDDFKVITVMVVLRNLEGLRAEEGYAVPCHGSLAKVWAYRLKDDALIPNLSAVEVTATDRCSNSTTRIVPWGGTPV